MTKKIIFPNNLSLSVKERKEDGASGQLLRKKANFV